MQHELAIRFSDEGWIPVEIEKYPNSDPLVKWNSSLAIKLSDNPFEKFSIYIRPNNFQRFIASIFFCQALKERGLEPLDLTIPCLPGMRQDRLNDSGDFLFTAKSVAQLINSVGFKRVRTLDAHSEVVVGLIDGCKNIPSSDIDIPNYDFEAVVSPDGGAEKRASKVAKKFEVPLIHGWKTRDISTGQISGFGFETPPKNLNKSDNILFVDDICDGGGTFIGLAEKFKEVGFNNLHLFVSHGYFTKGYDDLLKYFTTIITTDSVKPKYAVPNWNCQEKLRVKIIETNFENDLC